MILLRVDEIFHLSDLVLFGESSAINFLFFSRFYDVSGNSVRE